VTAAGTGQDWNGVPASAGLCLGCVHGRPVVNDRGSRFVLCDLSRTDARFPRYPRLPMVRCDGFDAIDPSARSARPDE
jgi:hypothetical protein